MVKLTTKVETPSSSSHLERWRKRTFLQPLGIICVLTFFIALNAVDCPLNFYGPKMFSDFGFSLSPRLLACSIPVGQLAGYMGAPLVMMVSIPLVLL